ncbi:hypothetical protein APHMUC_0101 [Anaplasma phagocytophilum str. ApMUC09]|uniref:Uncharacterized protein n=1 Tax=Anaplasma phagocytophilum str. ApMUC09 TaxID=1359152 RepID=A0A0F3NAA2_ANAPH|nr:hypothetical protein APHMUC_0101 [Anaplasma phagocytophilum str. ApMUC09]
MVRVVFPDLGIVHGSSDVIYSLGVFFGEEISSYRYSK